MQIPAGFPFPLSVIKHQRHNRIQLFLRSQPGKKLCASLQILLFPVQEPFFPQLPRIVQSIIFHTSGRHGIMQLILIFYRKHTAGAFPVSFLCYIPVSAPCSSASASTLFRMIYGRSSFQLFRCHLLSPAKYRAVYEISKNIRFLHIGTESVIFFSHNAFLLLFPFLNRETQRAKYAPANAVYGCLIFMAPSKDGTATDCRPLQIRFL